MSGKVLLKRDQADSKIESGLYLPPDKNEVVNIGTVLAARLDIPMDIGTKIAFRRGHDVTVEGEKLTVINEDDILVILN